MKDGRTTLYPMVQFKKDTWEIDEFDVASMYLLIGNEKAMLIDCGMGIGDLRGAVERITDKPLIVVGTHGHLDHTANAIQFEDFWLHPEDQAAPIPQDYRRRIFDIGRIAARQKGCIGAPYTMFHLYPYDINHDVRDYPEDWPRPKLHDLYDGQEFDLGGRIIKVYTCPGHSKGQVAFLDSKTRSLFCGDAVNFNLGINACPVETGLNSLKKLQSLQDQYDGIYNGHHDFRALGKPLDPDCLPTLISMLEKVVETGTYTETTDPSFWGQNIPLTYDPEDHDFGKPKRACIRAGRCWVFIDPKRIYNEPAN